MTITIDPEFSSLIPPQAPEARDALRESLRVEGCREPLTVWRGLLVDGHSRKVLCDELGVSYETRELDVSDRDAVKRWMFQTQIARRALTPDQTIALAVLRGFEVPAAFAEHHGVPKARAMLEAGETEKLERCAKDRGYTLTVAMNALARAKGVGRRARLSRLDVAKSACARLSAVEQRKLVEWLLSESR